MKRSWLAGLAFLAGCQQQPPTVIDGSSAETFEATTRTARFDLPDADRLVFDRAIRSVGGRRHANTDPAGLARTTFDGMTAAEVVADQKARD